MGHPKRVNPFLLLTLRSHIKDMEDVARLFAKGFIARRINRTDSDDAKARIFGVFGQDTHGTTPTTSLRLKKMERVTIADDRPQPDNPISLL